MNFVIPFKKLPLGYALVKKSDLKKFRKIQTRFNVFTAFLDGKEIKNATEATVSMESISQKERFKQRKGKHKEIELIVGTKTEVRIKTEKGKK